MSALETAEYIEQSHLFRSLAERLGEQTPLQDVLASIRHELLATTRLPLAVDFLLTELKHSGTVAPAMRRIPHYFTPYQTYLIAEAEREEGTFDMRTAVEILRADAEYRASGVSKPGLFMFQVESISRNRLRYDPGLLAISQDPNYEEPWRAFILEFRTQIGLVDFADLVFMHSEEYLRRCQQQRVDPPANRVWLFGEKEGRIAFANRRQEMSLLFSAMQRHLGYPRVPRPVPPDPTKELLPLLMRRVERLESRLKLMEEESRQGIDITKFYGHDKPPSIPGA